MIPIQITFDVEAAPWTDLTDYIVNRSGEPILLERIGLLRHGTVEGRATVALVFRLPGGTVAIAETSWCNFRLAAAALAASPVAAEEI